MFKFWKRKNPVPPEDESRYEAQNPVVRIEYRPEDQTVHCAAFWPVVDSPEAKVAIAKDLAKTLFLLNNGNLANALLGGIKFGGQINGDHAVVELASAMFERACAIKTKPLIPPTVAMIPRVYNRGDEE